MDYQEAKKRKAQLEANLANSSAALKPFPKLANGLTPDAVKCDPAFRAATATYAVDLYHLRRFNSYFVRTFASEYRAERRERK